MTPLSQTQKENLKYNLEILKHYRYPKEQCWEAYHFWARGGRGWNRYGLGGTYIMYVLCWYHFREKPNCREWRPPIIMKKLINERLST